MCVYSVIIHVIINVWAFRASRATRPCWKAHWIKQRMRQWCFTLSYASSPLSLHLARRFSPGQGLVLYPQIGDKMDIVCPRADASSGGKEEFYRVYLVSRSQMESCTIDKTDTPLLNCDKPHRDVKFTFKFQEYSPNLWGLEFLKGRDYYITCESLRATPQLLLTQKRYRSEAVCTSQCTMSMCNASKSVEQRHKLLVPTGGTMLESVLFSVFLLGGGGSRRPRLPPDLSVCVRIKKMWPRYWAAVG